MASDIAKRVREAFENTHPRNPLNKLQEDDKCLLWAWLTVYSSCEVKPKKRSDFVNRLEQTTKMAADAAALGRRIQTEVFQGEFAESIGPLLVGFKDLPLRLHAFASRLGGLFGVFGKPGHKGRMLNNQPLIMASEFVRLRTGGYYDEQLAELYQAISVEPESSSDTPEDFSGDAIRKKRENFQENYPFLYRQAMNEVLRRAGLRKEEKARGMDVLGAAFASGMHESQSNRSRYPKPGWVERLREAEQHGPTAFEIAIKAEVANMGIPNEAVDAGAELRSGRRSVRARARKD
jgi:hypothetical protein